MKVAELKNTEDKASSHFTCIKFGENQTRNAFIPIYTRTGSDQQVFSQQLLNCSSEIVLLLVK